MKNHTTTEELHSSNIQESDNLLMSEQAGYHQHYSILQMSHIYTHAQTQIHYFQTLYLHYIALYF